MSDHRFFLVGPLTSASLRDGTAEDIPLSPEDLHHAVAVLRVRKGERIAVVEPGGTVWSARVESASRRGLSGVVLGPVESAKEPSIVLVQGVTKGATMDSIVQHAVELGVEEIVTVLTDRTVVRLDEAKSAERAARWQRIAKGAAAQSQRVRVPPVGPPVALTELASGLSGHDLTIVLWEEASKAPGLAELVRAELSRRSAGTAADERAEPVAVSGLRVTLVVGPEGGLTGQEVDGLVAAGARVAGLGEAVLRTETAALAAIAVVSSELGFLGSPVVRLR